MSRMVQQQSGLSLIFAIVTLINVNGELGPDCYWTNWFDVDNPTFAGDFETLNSIKTLYSNDKSICDKPSFVECREKYTHRYYDEYEFNPNIEWTYCSSSGDYGFDAGFACRNNDNILGNECPDFETRFYCCPNTSSPTSYPTSHPTDICDHLEQEYHCCDTTSPTNIPTASPANRCCDKKKKCHVYNDPHFLRFDNTRFDFHGKGWYDYVKSCNNDYSLSNGFPFIVSGRQEQCVSSLTTPTCIEEVKISIYNPYTNTLFTTITFLNSNGIPSLGYGTYNTNFGIKYELSLGKFVGRFIDPNYGCEIEMIVEIYGGSVKIYISDCNDIFDRICGLCQAPRSAAGSNGRLLLLFDNDIDIYEYGDSFCNNFLQELEGESCERTDVSQLFIPSSQCLEAAFGCCYQVWNNYCKDICDKKNEFELTFDNFVQNCAFDACAMSQNKINEIGCDASMPGNLGFFDMPIAFCHDACN